MNIDIESVTVSRAPHPAQRVCFTITTETGSIALDMLVTPPAGASLVEFQRLAMARAAEILRQAGGTR